MAGAAIACSGAALGVKLLFEPFFDRVAEPFVFFTAAVAVATLVAGAAAGAITAVVTAVLAAYFFIAPYHSLQISPFRFASLALYLAESALLIWVVHLLQQAAIRVRESESAVKKSEELLQHVRRATNDAICDWDLESGEVVRGGGIEHAYGYALSSISGEIEWWKERVHPDDRARVLRSLDLALESGENWTAEYRFRRADGSYAYVLDRAILLRNDGKAVRAVGAMLDVTERRTEEERLKFVAKAGELFAEARDSEQVLGAITTLAVPALADWCAVDLAEGDAYRRIAMAHRDPDKVKLAWQMHESYGGREAGNVIATVIRSGQPQLLTSISDELLRDIAYDELHYERLRELGLRSWMIVPMCIRTRCIGAITFVATDESGMRYSENDMLRAGEFATRAALAVENARLYEELRRADRAKDEFFASLSHELRTPLTSIRGWLRLLQSGNADPQTMEEALAAIDSSSAVQAQLVDDLLDVSRIANGKLRIDPRPVDLSTVVASALAQMRPLADGKGVMLLSSGHPGVVVVADRERLHQVFTNVLSNAIKFTPPGGRVTIHTTLAGGQVMVRITDTGRGIASELVPHVFERYRQAAGGDTLGGLGLGLAIARHLVEAHAGTIEADSAGEGQGATFTISLPVDRSQIRPSRRESDERPESPRDAAPLN